MGVRTRSAHGSPIKDSTSSAQMLPTTIETIISPTKVLIVPRKITSESRLIHLKHPRDGALTRFWFCPVNGLFEFTKISATAGDFRSMLFSPTEMDTYEVDVEKHLKINNGFVSQGADILTATPFDLAFILLRVLTIDSISKNPMFQPLDDLLDIPESEDKHLNYVLKHGSSMVEQAMSSICDTVDAGDEKMYRFSEEKVLGLWLDRARRVVDVGLPASLEERFVIRVLEAPVLSVKREESTFEIQTRAPLQASFSNNVDSQSTTASTAVSVVFSEVSETSSVSSNSEPPENNIRYLLRLRVALNFIAATCFASTLSIRLQEKLSCDKGPLLFKPLDEELNRLAKLRAEAMASRSLTDFSRKRTNGDDDEAAEVRAEKKRKLEEDEKKRKANESRGVRDLKKVNVSGMKKMSAFFTKTPMATKAKT